MMDQTRADARAERAEDLLTAEEVAARLRCSTSQVYNGSKAGTLALERVQIGRSVRFRRIDLERLIGVEL